MRIAAACVIIIMLFSCNKAIQVALPEYKSEITIEMYLEDGKELRCLLSESLPYTDSAINRPLDSALVVFSDGVRNDTLKNKLFQDWESGRVFNYSHPRILAADLAKTYSITVTDNHNRTLTASTNFLSMAPPIDSIVTRESENNKDSFSLGVIFQDPYKSENYYRLLIAKKLTDFNADQTDILFNDLAFNGKAYSFYSDADYARGDSVTIRLYALQKEYYDYIKSAEDARSSNFSPFVQPAWIKSNVTGGLGIFTAITYHQREIVIR